MQTPRDVAAVVYAPRQDGGPNGRITRYEVQVSSNGTDFTTVATGTWNTTDDAKLAEVPAGTTARYVRLVGVEVVANYASAAEVNVAVRSD